MKMEKKKIQKSFGEEGESVKERYFGIIILFTTFRSVFFLCV